MKIKTLSKVILIFSAVFWAFSVSGQSNNKSGNKTYINQDTTINKANIENFMNEFSLIQAENPPAFPGGQAGMQNFLATNLKYPPKALKEKKEGTVWVDALINKDGLLSNPRILKTDAIELNEEALRLVKLMPKWKAGTLKGNAVPCNVKIPVKFVYPKSGK